MHQSFSIIKIFTNVKLFSSPNRNQEAKYDNSVRLKKGINGGVENVLRISCTIPTHPRRPNRDLAEKWTVFHYRCDLAEICMFLLTASSVQIKDGNSWQLTIRRSIF